VTGKLVFENLKHRPMRSLLSVLLIGVPVTLQLTLVGLSHGFLEGSQERARGIGADVVVRPKNSSVLGSLSSAGLSDAYIPVILQQPHVLQAMGVINQEVKNVTLGATGIDLDAFNRMSGGFHFIEGRAFRGSDEVVVDRYYAAENHLHAGSMVNLFNHPWRVSGIIEEGKLQRIAFPIQVLQELFEHPHKFSQIYIKLDNPANADQVVANLKKLMDDDQIYSMAEFTSLYNINNVPALAEFIAVVMGIGVVIGFAVVCLSMYMSVLQRTREIGILKSLGASKLFILRIILVESVIMGIGGTVLGILMSYGAYWLLRVLRPASFPIAIVHEWWLYAGAITVVGALLGALYPGLHAAAHDPIEALSYE
jgi:putative ABC transport system permease protein